MEKIFKFLKKWFWDIIRVLVIFWGVIMVVVSTYAVIVYFFLQYLI